MRRRGFLGGALALAAASARAQERRRPFRVGVLSPTFVAYDFARPAVYWLGELGLQEGRDFTVESRFAAGRDDLLSQLAAELVRLEVDAIVTQGATAIRAAKQATGVIPIVMIADGDPVADGIVRSLARPGGNLTGVALQSAELAGKRLELMVEMLPQLARVGLLMNPDDTEREAELKVVAAASVRLGLTTQILPVRRVAEFEAAVARARDSGCGAVLVLPDRTIGVNINQVQDLALAARLPTIYPYRWYVDIGGSAGLMSYGPIPVEVSRRAASFIDRIRRGAKPADLPIEQPAVFELVVNLKVARALGLAIPLSILARADELIE